MKGQRFLLAIWLLTGLLVTTTAQDAGKDKNEKRRVYDHDKKFSIIPPVGWDEEIKTNNKTVILSRQAGIKDNLANFTVVRTEIENKDDFSEDASKALDKLKGQFKSVVVDEEKETTLNGRKANYTIFSFKHETAGKAVPLAMAIYLIDGEGVDAYVVTITFSPALSKRLKPLIKEAANSIRIAQ